MQFVILGLLLGGPLSLYDIRRRFENVDGDRARLRELAASTPVDDTRAPVLSGQSATLDYGLRSLDLADA